jgi:hypothetical protein
MGGGMGPMMPQAPRYIPMDHGNGISQPTSNSHAPITITKLE